MHTLHDLFLNELSDCYDGELRISKALPRMMGAATSDELTRAFQAHLKISEAHLKKLDKVFECFDRKARRKTCEAVMGILREGEDMVAAFAGCAAVHAVMLVAVQRAGHYKMATCGCLQEWALRLEKPSAAALLHEILREGEAASKQLAVLARTIQLDPVPVRSLAAGAQLK